MTLIIVDDTDVSQIDVIGDNRIVVNCNATVNNNVV